MTEPKPHEFIIRATECELVAQVVKIGNNPPTVLEVQPRPLWAVSAEAPGQPLEIIGTFSSAEDAQEAAEALTQQMKAIVGTEGEGLKLASIDGRTLQ